MTRRLKTKLLESVSGQRFTADSLNMFHGTASTRNEHKFAMTKNTLTFLLRSSFI